MESNVKSIYIRTVTNVSGDPMYYIYNNNDCIGNFILNGNMNFISNENYEIIINPNIEINKNFSIKTIDNNGCEYCINYILPDVTPIYISPTPMVSPTPTPTPTLIFGNCYEITVDENALINNLQDLYIVKRSPINNEFYTLSYNDYPSVDNDNGTITLFMCSIEYPLFSYGEFGPKFTPSSEINITIGGTCQNDLDCQII